MGRLAVLVVLLFGLARVAHADLYKVDGPAPGWCEFAAQYLEPVGNRPAFRCAADGTMIDGKRALCIRLNNYGCLWQRRASWPGTDIEPGNNGAHDGRGGRNGHSVFTHPKYALAAKFHWFANRKSQSALSHAETYLPWCDTLGSVDRRGSFYRSCGLKPSQLKPGRSYCRKPTSGTPSAAQCGACNCPSELAAVWVEGTGLGINDPLVLVTADGKPADLLVKIALRNSVNELGGYRPTRALIDEAVITYGLIYGK